jgi:hypothetical protein
VDAGSVLGVQPLRPAFLDYLSAAESRQTKNDHRVRAVTTRDNLLHGFVLEDDDELDDEDDEFDDEEEDEDEEDDEDEDTETWQVSGWGPFR